MLNNQKLKLFIPLCLLLMVLILQTIAMASDPVDYLVHDVKSDDCPQLSGAKFNDQWRKVTIYLPNNSNTILIDPILIKRHPYPIRVFYQGHISKTPYYSSINYYVCTRTPYIQYRILKPDGTTETTVTMISGPNKSATSYLDIPKDRGLAIDMYNGQHDRYFLGISNSTGLYVCSLQLKYNWDQAPPNIPTLSISGSGTKRVKQIGTKLHTSYNDPVITWSATDNPTTSVSLNTTYGPAQIKDYLVEWNKAGQPVTQWWTSQTQMAFNEGEYQIKIKARDQDGNESPFGNPVTLVVDRSIKNITLPATPVSITETGGIFTATINWDPIADISGIKYQIGITRDLMPPTVGLIETGTNQFVFTYTDIPGSTLYAYIQAIDGVNNCSGWERAEIKPTAPKVSVQATPHASVSNGQAQYFVELQLEDNPEAAEYIILREGPNPAIPMEPVPLAVLTYAQLKDSHFQYIDENNLQKHCRYRYHVYTKNECNIVSEKTITPDVLIPNITPNPSVSGPRPVEVIPQITFGLGTTRDFENDGLEYRLYTRVPGTVSGSLIQSWTPTGDNQSVTLSFPDLTTFEWRLCCVESEWSIPDKVEVALTEWKSLSIDTHYPLPRCFNVFGENLWGTPGQTLRFQVETNPGVHMVDYIWDFGDGSLPGSGQEVTHIYHQLSRPEAPYQVTLTATDSATGLQHQGVIAVRIINTSRGQLYADETWSGIHTVDGDIIVPAEIHLSVDAGTQVRIQPDLGLVILGELQVGNGAILDASSGLWKGIRFNEGGWGIIEGATISKAVRGVSCTGSGQITLRNSILDGNTTGIHCLSGNITIIGCNLINNSIYGIKEDRGCSPLVQNCLFQGNGIPYYDTNLLQVTIEQLNQGSNLGNEFR